MSPCEKGWRCVAIAAGLSGYAAVREQSAVEAVLCAAVFYLVLVAVGLFAGAAISWARGARRRRPRQEAARS